MKLVCLIRITETVRGLGTQPWGGALLSSAGPLEGCRGLAATLLDFG